MRTSSDHGGTTFRALVTRVGPESSGLVSTLVVGFVVVLFLLLLLFVQDLSSLWHADQCREDQADDE